jgi:hypothetical protein
MYRLAVLVIAASTLSCSPSEDLSQPFVPPASMPPTMRAPICARPAEKAAIDVSVLVSQLQLITMTCHTRTQYNALIPRLRPALATKEKNLSAFFKRAYGKQAQTEHDRYITELANLQSQEALKSGDRFCSMSSSIFDQVKPLSTVEQLATYAQSAPIQPALAVDECPAGSTPKATPRGRGRQTASR